MSRIRQVWAADGTPILYDPTVVAYGQKKDCCFCDDGRSVLLWYREPIAPVELERLQAVVGAYRERLFGGPGGAYWEKLMCWPSQIVKDGGRIGIVAPRYPSQFLFELGSRNGDPLKLKGKEKQGYWFVSLKHREQTLDRQELGDWRLQLRMALRIARALRRLHAAGLVHGDLSYRNVLLDPPRGDACLIDLDGLVVPGRFPPEVIGSPDFMAPEIVATRHLPREHPDRRLPDWATDLHSLAVLIYLLLLLRHPLRGDAIHDADDDDRQETLIMGSAARFIEHPSDSSNRLRSDWLDPFEKPWRDTAALPYQTLGPYLSALVERAFVQGLHTPALRPTAQEWEWALQHSANSLYPCANALCSAQWFVFDPANPRCPFCLTKIDQPVFTAHLYRHNGSTFAPANIQKVLHHHAELFDWHLDSELTPNETLPAANQARRAYTAWNQGQLWLVNESIADLTVLDGKLSIPPGKQLPITANQQLLVKRAPTPHLIWLQCHAPQH